MIQGSDVGLVEMGHTENMPVNALVQMSRMSCESNKEEGRTGKCLGVM